MARPGLTRHRKFRRLTLALGSPIIARGALELLWDACYECGDDYVGTADDIEGLTGWTGEAGALTRALVDAGAPEGHGFIEAINSVSSELTRYRVHDLWHHAPEYVAKRRKRELERIQKVAPTVKRRRTAPNGGQRPPSSDRQNGDGRTPSPPPSPSPVEESGEPLDGSPPSLRVRAEGGEVLVTFPVVGNNGTEWRLRRRQVEEWQALFPNLNVLDECRHALGWIRANPRKRKTVTGMPRFLNAWLTRSVDRRSGGGGRAANEPSGPIVPDEQETARMLEAYRHD